MLAIQKQWEMEVKGIFQGANTMFEFQCLYSIWRDVCAGWGDGNDSVFFLRCAGLVSEFVAPQQNLNPVRNTDTSETNQQNPCH